MSEQNPTSPHSPDPSSQGATGATGDPGAAADSGAPGTDATLTAPQDRALSRPDFPFARVARRLGLDPSGAEVALRDGEQTRAAISRASRAFLAADDDRRAGRIPADPIALDPDFPTGVGMSLVGAAVLWEYREFVPQIALRVAKDHYEDGRDDLAASFIALVQESVEPGRGSGPGDDGGMDDDAPANVDAPVDDGAPGGGEASAWAAQSLLVSVLQRSGSPAQADEIARDLAAHNIPLDLWRADDPTLPDDSMAWHGGAFVGGIPPRRDERHLSYEDVHDYLDQLLADMRREEAAEAEQITDRAGGPPAGDQSAGR